MNRYRTTMMPTPAVWSRERLAALREHLTTQSPDAEATMSTCFGPATPIHYEGYPLRVRDAVTMIDRWAAGRLDAAR